jgi:hypothetical protein
LQGDSQDPIFLGFLLVQLGQLKHIFLGIDENRYPAKTVDETSNMHGSCSAIQSSSQVVFRITNQHP